MTNKLKRSDFKVGDVVTIIEKPSSWNSIFCDKCPITDSIYPYTATIEKLGSENWPDACKIGDYGYGIDNLIEKGVSLHNKVLSSGNRELVSKLSLKDLEIPPPIITAEDGLWAVAMASGLLEAGKTGNPVDLTTLADRLAAS